mgnify:CR=1 FL=1
MLDTWPQRAGFSPSQVRGYERSVPAHLAVAQVIAAGGADAGPGNLAAARAFGLDVVPLHQERYDLVLPREYLDSAPIQALLDVVVSLLFRRELDALGGYDSARAGTMVAEFSPCTGSSDASSCVCPGALGTCASLDAWLSRQWRWCS